MHCARKNLFHICMPKGLTRGCGLCLQSQFGNFFGGACRQGAVQLPSTAVQWTCGLAVNGVFSCSGVRFCTRAATPCVCECVCVCVCVCVCARVRVRVRKSGCASSVGVCASYHHCCRQACRVSERVCVHVCVCVPAHVCPRACVCVCVCVSQTLTGRITSA